MTRTTNARIAGVTFFVYIAAGMSSLAISTRAMGGTDVAARLANIAQHGTDVRVVVMLAVLMSFSAMVLGVTLYAITREQDPDLAMLGLTCRMIEAVNASTSLAAPMGLLSLATASGANAPDGGAAQAFGAFLLRGSPDVSAIFFAVGSTLFCWLLLRGRMIPAAMAWLGVIASALLVAVLPLQFFGLLGGPTSWSSPLTWLMWLPMLVFEVTFALWLIIKGVAVPPRAPSAATS